MRPVALLLVAGFLVAGCSRGGSTVPSTTPSPSAPPASSPRLVRISLCCDRDPVTVVINSPRQIEARATYSDDSTKDITTAVTSWKSSNPSIAPISSTGVLTGLVPGIVDITATYSGLEATSRLYLYDSPFRPPYPNEITGFVREISALGPIDLSGAEVEVAGGGSNGRKVQANGGLFRIDGLQAPDFDLLIRRRGYATARVHVGELGRELSINLTAAPGVVSDLLEGDVCWPTRTITRTFTAKAPGLLRITAPATPPRDAACTRTAHS